MSPSKRTPQRKHPLQGQPPRRNTPNSYPLHVVIPLRSSSVKNGPEKTLSVLVCYCRFTFKGYYLGRGRAEGFQFLRVHIQKYTHRRRIPQQELPNRDTPRKEELKAQGPPKVKRHGGASLEESFSGGAWGVNPRPNLTHLRVFFFQRYSPLDFIFPLIAFVKELLLVILLFAASSWGRFPFRGFSFCWVLFSGCFFLGIAFLGLGGGILEFVLEGRCFPRENGYKLNS